MSEMMTMVREIRDANSRKRMSMTQAQRNAEDEKIVKWFQGCLNRPLKTMSTATPKIRRAR